ncbi:AMP-binding protein [Nocardia sp. NPDC051750]|uniref:non-ribosomal peptide synthetase n=1 Tax=Nocardia sp. NPDC051750 TaxID=3364325 RepID=UPI0037B91877
MCHGPEFLKLFDDIVREHHDRVAVDAHDGMWTFAALAEHSRLWARELRAAGVRPGDVVALRTGHSAWHIASVLALWRLHAAFLPIDPAAPDSRGRDILIESRARAVIFTDDAGPRAERLPGDHPPLSAPADDLAYVIYTSGSTGRPKGVRIAHSGLVPMLAAQISMFDLGPGARALLTLSTAFDGSISDIGTALLSGATLVIPRHPASAGTLPELLRTRAITHADLPPSLLTRIDPASAPACLRVVVIGGEVCAPDTVRAWAARVRLVNVYGPTEATVCTSMQVCDPQTWARPLLGTPLPHIEYDLVDGELLISGSGLALGYIDRPDAERARFLERAGRRWYRTGDLVRAHASGEWEFLGRIDRQVKIHGRLICPEEIEACLRAIDGVREAAVVALPAVGGYGATDAVATLRADIPVTLVAHVGLRDPGQLSAGEIRTQLARSLPAWMLPRIEVAGALDRGATGKIDHRALVRHTARHPVAEDAAVDHRTEVIAESFAAALGLAEIGADEDFGQLGGNSLSALRVVAEAGVRGVDIELTTVLTARTPTAIARAPRHTHRTVEALDRLAGHVAAEAGATRLRAGTGSDWLITGASGFLGGRLPAELLSRTGARVHCLVRGTDTADAAARLGAIADHPRIRVHAGDIAAPFLGLPRDTWSVLCERVGVVVHAAAAPSLTLPFSDLAAVTVRGAAEIARFARSSGAKVHHISSLAVLASSDLDADVLDEHIDPEPGTRVHGAYPQTKWAAESVLTRRVPNLCVIRPGLLTADSHSGAGAARCPLTAFLRAVAVLRCLPDTDDDRWRVNITPVDHAVTAIATILTGDRHPPRVHVAGEHGVSLRRLRTALSCFVPVETVTAAEFLRRAREHLAPDDALALVVSSYRLTGTDAHRDADLFLQTGRRFPAEVLRATTGAALPPIDHDLLCRYAEFAVRSLARAQ